MKLALCVFLGLVGTSIAGHLSSGNSHLSILQPTHFLSPSFFSVPSTTWTVAPQTQEQNKRSERPKTVTIPASGSGPITIRLQLDGNSNSGNDIGDDTSEETPAQSSVEDTGAPENDGEQDAVEIEDEQSEEPVRPSIRQNSSRRPSNNERRTPSNVRRPVTGASRNSNMNAFSRLRSEPEARSNSGNRFSGSPFSDVSIVRAINIGNFELEETPNEQRSLPLSSGGGSGYGAPVNEISEVDEEQPQPVQFERQEALPRSRGREPQSRRPSSGSRSSNRGSSNRGSSNRGSSRNGAQRSRLQTQSGRRNTNNNRSAGRNNLRGQSGKQISTADGRVIQFQIIQPASIIPNPAEFVAPPLIRFLSH